MRATNEARENGTTHHGCDVSWGVGWRDTLRETTEKRDFRPIGFTERERPESDEMTLETGRPVVSPFNRHAVTRQVA